MDLISVARMCHRQTETIRKRRHRSGDGSGWTKLGLLTAVLIGVLLQCDFQQAADWLLGRRRNRVSWQQPLAKPELVVVLEQLFLSMSVEEVLDLEDAETSPLGAAQYRLAVEWAHDRKLASWVRSKNDSAALLSALPQWLRRCENSHLPEVTSHHCTSGLTARTA